MSTASRTAARPDRWSPDADSRPSPLRGHRWIHITGTWDTKDAERCKIYINGQLLPGTATAFYAEYAPKTSVPWFTHQDGSQNCLRLGATSSYSREGIRKYQRNWPADATLDEFYWWNSFLQLSSAMEIERLGRFYNPCHGTEEGVFTSQAINLASTPRSLAPPSISSAAAKRTCSRRARSSAVSPPPSGYLMTPA